MVNIGVSQAAIVSKHIKNLGKKKFYAEFERQHPLFSNFT
jgi:hypothetical protein